LLASPVSAEKKQKPQTSGRQEWRGISMDQYIHVLNQAERECNTVRGIAAWLSGSHYGASSRLRLKEQTIRRSIE